ncbi:Ribonuclease H-like domain-containing protein [Artemisia annua]|uniref:Ribonuclease H-like domain-containing protein n=1 Tax=Artemisia annua TaxID=35608 RepID=A0A2U1PN48_ARTAN|nr:Ribonuclease H-like domain-containing protein [Artemisia annua]
MSLSPQSPLTPPPSSSGDTDYLESTCTFAINVLIAFDMRTTGKANIRTNYNIIPCSNEPESINGGDPCAAAGLHMHDRNIPAGCEEQQRACGMLCPNLDGTVSHDHTVTENRSGVLPDGCTRPRLKRMLDDSVSASGSRCLKKFATEGVSVHPSYAANQATGRIRDIQFLGDDGTIPGVNTPPPQPNKSDGMQRCPLLLDFVSGTVCPQVADDLNGSNDSQACGQLSSSVPTSPASMSVITKQKGKRRTGANVQNSAPENVLLKRQRLALPITTPVHTQRIPGFDDTFIGQSQAFTATQPLPGTVSVVGNVSQVWNEASLLLYTISTSDVLQRNAVVSEHPTPPAVTRKMKIANPQSSRLVWETILKEFTVLGKIAARLLFLHATSSGFKCSWSFMRWEFGSEEDKEAELFAIASGEDDDMLSEIFVDAPSL